MSNCCVLEFKLIDDTTNIEVNLEDNTQEIKVNLTDYNDSAIKKEIKDLSEEVAENTEARHTHSNKQILDNTTASYTQEEQEKLSSLHNYDDTEIKEDISNLEENKVDKVNGKGLSTNDYTDLEKEKLASLENYDDTEIKEDIANLEKNKANRSEIPDVSEFITKEVNNLTHYELKTNTGSSIDLSIDNNTYVMTLSLKNSAGNILNTQTVDLPLETMVVGGSYDNVNKKIILTLKNGNTIDIPVSDLISGLQSEITPSNKLSSDLVDDTNKINKFVTNQEKETWNNKSDFSGDYNDLSNKPTIPDELKDLSDDTTHRTVTDTEKNTWNNKSDFSGDYNDLENKPSIPSEVTEQTVANWGFTKNTGTYSKPSGGIPKTDLDSNVQSSLNKADSALQEHQDISGKLDTIKVKNTNSTTAGDVYDVRYINSMIGDIETILTRLTTGSGV